MYVYFIKAFDNPPMMKIGKSNNPEERVKSLQTGCPSEILLFAKVRCRSERHALYVEKLIHRSLRRHHERGEWFKCSTAVVRKALEWQSLSAI